ncbi:MAG: fructose-1,6-bisphosphatase [Candidatus Micrarchaeota archaeon]|nr:fructose-1,6-bisphosphatase [Candidatus Micrarchaeota archaeon]
MLGQTFKEFIEGIHPDKDVKKILYSLHDCIVNISYAFPDKLDTKALKENKFGESTKELDSWSNTYFIENMRNTELVKILYSEEEDEPVLLNEDGKFYMTLDPLDGSSNIISNNPFGTIVSVYDKELPCKGKYALFSMYALYGPITTLVIAIKGKTSEFVKTWKPKEEFRLVKDELILPEPGEVFGIGGNITSYEPKFYAFVKKLAKEKKLKLRYCGALVGDFSQVLHYGGLFAYPAMIGKPEGKLRLFFEAIPMSMIISNAKGKGSNGRIDILEIEADTVYAKTPFYIGNKSIIDELENVLK